SLSGGIGAACALLLACTSKIEAPQGGPSGQVGGSGAASGSTSGSGAQGVGGSSAVTGSVDGSVGTSTGSGGTGMIPQEPPRFQPAPGMLRRLTRTQFKNAVSDVFGVEVDVSALDADHWTEGFASIGAASVVTSQLGVEQYHTAIENAVS